MTTKLFNQLLFFLRISFNYLLILIGLFITLWIIWSRFIRERLPKDIPFNLSELGFYLILYICCIYLYIIISLLFSCKNNNVYIAKLAEIFFLPLSALDEAIKHSSLISPYYYRFLAFYTPNRLDTFGSLDYRLIYITYNILPRLLLISVLFFDTFFLHHLEFIYSFVLFGIFPLFYRYFYYSLKFARKDFLTLLSKKYSKVHLFDSKRYQSNWEDLDPLLFHDKTVTIEEYLELDYAVYIYNFDNLFPDRYDSYPYMQHDFYKEYIINKYGNYSFETQIYRDKEDLKFIKKEYYDIIPNLLLLNRFLEIFKDTKSTPVIKYPRIFIYSVYFICWSYILFVSFINAGFFPITENIISSLFIFMWFIIFFFNNFIDCTMLWGELYLKDICTCFEWIEPFSGIML